MRWALTRLRVPLATTLTAVVLTIGAGGPAGPHKVSLPPAADPTTGSRAPHPCTTKDITLPGRAGQDTYRLRLCIQARHQPHGRELRAALAIRSYPVAHPRRATFVASGVLKVCRHPTTLAACVTSREFQTGAAGSAGTLRHSPWWAVGACPRDGAYVAVLTDLVLHGRPSSLTVRPIGEPDLESPPRAACPTTLVLV